MVENNPEARVGQVPLARGALMGWRAHHEVSGSQGSGLPIDLADPDFGGVESA